MASNTAAAPAAADYGIDAPPELRRLIWRGGSLVLLGLGFFVMNRGDAIRGGIAMFVALGILGLGFLLAAGLMFWSSRTGKIAYRDAILDSIPWRGDEKVLDVGCGRGLLGIGAAKRLRTGKVTGIDVWNKEHLSGNTAEAAVANAKTEGVAERIRFENGDARRLPYPANFYDVVLSSLALHTIKEDDEREKAVLELLRVSKPGGHIAVLDVFHTGDFIRLLEKNEAEIVRKSGLSLLWCAPTRWFVARKRG